MPMRAALLALAGLLLDAGYAQEAPAPIPILNGLSLEDYSVQVRADAETATVVVEERFFNAGRGLREASFLFPLPEGAVPSGLELLTAGHFSGGSLLRRERARRIYDDITRRSRDPAILECAGKQLYRCRVFPVPAHDRAVVRFSYRQPLRAKGSLRRLRIPLDATRFNRRPAGHFALSIHLRTKSALQAVFSPTHSVRMRRIDAREAILALEARNAFLAKDLVLLYAVEEAPFGAVVASFKEPGRRGYFVLSIDAAFAAQAQAAAPRDVVLAVDTSSSSGREGIDQAAAAVAAAVSDLKPGDRFALMGFATEPRLLRPFLPVGEDAATAIRDLFHVQPAAGRTRLDAAVFGAARLAGEGRPGTGIILLTDGIDTGSGTDPLEALQKTAAGGHRVGLCGIGREMDTLELDAAGEAGRGDSAYALRDRSLPDSVRHLLETTRAVPLTDVSIRMEGTAQLFPRRLRVVRPGDPILLAGRYSGSGPRRLEIRATVGGRRVTHAWIVDLKRAGGDPGVARLWAARYVGSLLEQAREASDPSLHRTEILRVGRKFGIVTPHTALLVLEEADQRRFLAGMRRRPLLNTDGGALVARRSVTREAVSEAELAARIRRLERCRSGDVNPFADLLGANRLKLRRVAGRTFYLDMQATWIESGLVDRRPADPRRIKFLSKEWSALLDTHPDLAGVLALGRNLLFELEPGVAVEIVA